MRKNDITGVILAGGRGGRMDGADKGLVTLGGQPMIARVIARLGPQVSTLLISANRNLDTYQQFGLPVFSDRIAGYCGPLAGMHSALSAITTEWLISAPCDTPFLPNDYVTRMRNAITDQLAAVAYDGERMQAGFCLLHHSLLPQLVAQLSAREFAVHRFLDKVQALRVDFSDTANAFQNINTTIELEHAKRLLAEHLSG